MNAFTRGSSARLALAALGAAAVVAILAGVAGAVTGTATLTAGSLSIPTPTSLTFAGTLAGTAQDLKDTLTTADMLTVLNQGHGDGWNITAYTGADAFKCTTSGTCGTDSLTNFTTNGAASTSAADTTAPVATCTGTCVLPSNTATSYGTAISADSASPTKLFNAAAGTGIGAINVNNIWWLSVPANALAGTYVATVTLAINSGP